MSKQKEENKEIHVVFEDLQRFMTLYEGDYCGLHRNSTGKYSSSTKNVQK